MMMMNKRERNGWGWRETETDRDTETDRQTNHDRHRHETHNVNNQDKHCHDGLTVVYVLQGSGAFLFVRFPLSRGENVFGVAKACIQAKTSDLGGRFVGIARKVSACVTHPISSRYHCLHVRHRQEGECMCSSSHLFQTPLSSCQTSPGRWVGSSPHLSCGADGCIPLIMLADVCQCCCLLMFICFPLLRHFPYCKTWWIKNPNLWIYCGNTPYCSPTVFMSSRIATNLSKQFKVSYRGYTVFMFSRTASRPST